MYIKDAEPVEVLWTDWKIYKRTPVETYNRVMWYLRPVSGYNLWKKAEFYSRKYFDEDKVSNSEFIRKRGNQWK